MRPAPGGCAMSWSRGVLGSVIGGALPALFRHSGVTLLVAGRTRAAGWPPPAQPGTLWLGPAATSLPATDPLAWPAPPAAKPRWPWPWLANGPCAWPSRPPVRPIGTAWVDRCSCCCCCCRCALSGPCCFSASCCCVCSGVTMPSPRPVLHAPRCAACSGSRSGAGIRPWPGHTTQHRPPAASWCRQPSPCAAAGGSVCTPQQSTQRMGSA